MSENGAVLDAALGYAARGWPVLALHDVVLGRCSCLKGAECATPGKHPRFRNWPQFASCDPQLIRGWWKGWPSANVGVLTGRRSNLVVLDVDPRHGGDEALAVFAAKHGPLPETATVDTGGGGRHFYFLCPPGDEPVKSITIATGLELKGDGTFVVAPPSQT